MNNITKELIRYRECCRHLWNAYLMDTAEGNNWDAVDKFRDIQSILFDQLLCDGNGAGINRSMEISSTPYIQIIPTQDNVPIAINRSQGYTTQNYWDDSINRVSPAGIRLQFLDFFDWDQIGIRDFEYYLVFIREFNQFPDRVGRRALLQIRYGTPYVVE